MINQGLSDLKNTNWRIQLARSTGVSEGTASLVATTLQVLVFVAKPTPAVGAGLIGLDVALSVKATYDAPRTYSSGWPGAVDVNTSIPLDQFGH